jgi:excisionase family DNA binding protein
MKPLLLTPVDAAAVLGISRTTLYHLTRSGVFTPLRFGRATRYIVADLEEYVDSHRGIGASVPVDRSI